MPKKPDSSYWCRSVLGDPIYLKAEARRKDASRFWRTIRNLPAFDKVSNEILHDLWRKIAFGVFSSVEAFQLLNGTLSAIKQERLEHFLYLIEFKFCTYKDFEITTDLCGEAKEIPPANIIVSRSEVLDFNE